MDMVLTVLMESWYGERKSLYYIDGENISKWRKEI